MTLSFNGGMHEVRIYKDGKKYDLTTTPYLFNSIISTSVKFGNAYLGDIEVQLSPTITDGMKILESGLLGIGFTEKGQAPESEVTSKEKIAVPLSDKVSEPTVTKESELLNSVYPILAIRYLYPGQTDNDGTEASTPWFTGILNTPVVSLTETEISIVLKAGSSAIIPAKIIATTSFSNKSIYDCINAIIKPFGYILTFDEDDEETKDLLQSKYYNGTQSEPVMATVKSMLLSVDCYFQVISGDSSIPQDQIRVKSRKSLHEGNNPDFTFVLYRQIDPLNNVIPIYNFSTQSNGGLFFPGSVFGGDQKGVDSDTKKIETLTTDDKSDKTKALTGNNAGLYKLPGDSGTFGTSTGIKQTDPKIELTGTNTPIVKRGTSSNTSEIEAKTLQDGSLGLVYNFTVPGLPRLRALRLAQVIIGDNIKGFSGLGQIYWVTHRTGGDGWVSEIEFRRQPGLIDGAKLDARNIEPASRPNISGSKNAIDIRGLV